MATEPIRHLISTDGITFREATPEEIEVIELREKEEQAKREEALSKELPFGVKLYIKNLIQNFESRSKEDEEILEMLKKYRELYPYRNFGYWDFCESSGYLEDTISCLKDLIKEK